MLKLYKPKQAKLHIILCKDLDAQSDQLDLFFSPTYFYVDVVLFQHELHVQPCNKTRKLSTKIMKLGGTSCLPCSESSDC